MTSWEFPCNPIPSHCYVRGHVTSHLAGKFPNCPNYTTVNGMCFNGKFNNCSFEPSTNEFGLFFRSCQSIHYIPEYVQTRPLTDEMRTVKEEMEKSISKINLALKTKKKNIKEDKKSKATYLEEIKAFRKEINETLDRLEKASVTTVTETFGETDQRQQDDMKAIEATLQSLTKSKAELESSQGNLSQQFAKTKLCENILSNVEQKCTESRAIHEGHIHFERNSEILGCLRNLDSMMKKAEPMKQSMYEIVSNASYNVKLSTNATDCRIWSSCILDSGDILLAEFNNGYITLVDGESYKVLHSLEMSAGPWSVCKISSEEAAICLTNETVQFLSTKNQLNPTRSLKFDHDCRGIASIDGHLIVWESFMVHMYTMNGGRIKTIEKDQTGSDMFRSINEICESDDGLKIHVADNFRGVITIDKNGKLVWKYSSQELKGAFGVCTDGNGNVFVIGDVSHNVVQLGHDGQYLGEVVSKEHGIKSLLAISFDKEKHKLYAAGNGNELHVFDIQ